MAGACMVPVCQACADLAEPGLQVCRRVSGSALHFISMLLSSKLVQLSIMSRTLLAVMQSLTEAGYKTNKHARLAHLPKQPLHQHFGCQAFERATPSEHALPPCTRRAKLLRQTLAAVSEVLQCMAPTDQSTAC